MKFDYDCALIVVGYAVRLDRLDPSPTPEKLIAAFEYLALGRSEGRFGLHAFLPGELELAAGVPLEAATHFVVGAVVAEARFDPVSFAPSAVEAARREVAAVPKGTWLELATHLGLQPELLTSTLETLAFVSTGDEGGNRGGVAFGVLRPSNESPRREHFAVADVYDTPPAMMVDGVEAQAKGGRRASFEYEEVCHLDVSSEATAMLRIQVPEPEAVYYLYSEYG